MCMTDRERLIELLKYAPFMKQTHGVIWVEAMAQWLIDNGVTFAQDTDVGSKWISVEDRLPEEGEVVMCRHKAREYPVFCQWDESDLCWENTSWTFGRGLITHWMPLPEPPKED